MTQLCPVMVEPMVVLLVALSSPVNLICCLLLLAFLSPFIDCDDESNDGEQNEEEFNPVGSAQVPLLAA